MNKNSTFFHLNWKDTAKALVSAVVVAMVGGLASMVGADFNVFTADWLEVGKTIVNLGFITFVGRLAEKLLTTQQGEFLGAIKL